MKSATTTTKIKCGRPWQDSRQKPFGIHTVRHIYLTTMTLTVLLM